jgi:hypothetical protein
MPSTSWDVDLLCAGTVEGIPVNCRLQFRTGETGLTEVWVHREGDPHHQSTISRSPSVHDMAQHLIQEFHAAQRTSAAPRAGDPGTPTSEECQVVSLHDYLCRSQADSDTDRAALGGD